MAHSPSAFAFDALSIVLTDLVLAGDNGVVIAMAAKALPDQQRKTGIAIGAGVAVVLRVILTFYAAQALQLPYVMLAGGLLILWIAVQLLISGVNDPETARAATSLRQAIWMIVVADTTMSLDNILAVAAIAKEDLLLLIGGLGLSIPFVVFTSSALARFMDRYPILVWVGAAILGRVGGGMLLADPWIKRMLQPSEVDEIAAQVSGAAIVVFAGWAIRARTKRGKDRIPNGVS
jgi:YjbE family integral membrane protein